MPVPILPGALQIFASLLNKYLWLVATFRKRNWMPLTARGVNIEGVQIKKDEKTFFWSGRYHMDMNTRDTLETQLNVLGKF